MARVALSCTNLTLSGDQEINTCVQIFPPDDNRGNFTEIDRCNAVYNGTTCECTVCTPEQHNATVPLDVRQSTNSTSSVTVNCCNVQEGALATCTPINPAGRTFVQFDALEDGTCPDEYKTSGAAEPTTAVSVIAGVVSVAASLLFGV